MASPPPPHDRQPGAASVPPVPSAPAGDSRVKPRHYLWIVGAALVLVAALRWLGPVLTPFLIGAILAYLGTPIVAAARRSACPAPRAPCWRAW